MWMTRVLGDICDEVQGTIQTGPFGSQLHEYDYEQFGTPVVMPKDIIEGRVSESSIARVGSSHVERLSRHKLKSGDIVYGRRGDIGRQALITVHEEGWLCGTGCLRISLGQNNLLDPRFLHYYLRESNVIDSIAKQAIGSTLPNLNTTILKGIPITFPTIIIQHKIANILSTYDDLIENNQRRIAILEEMARNLYREWFVHFRFPGHEQAAFRETELGHVPEEWEIVRFTDIVDVFSGGTPKTSVSEYWDGNIPWFTPRDRPESFYVLDTSKNITELGLSKCNSKLYPTETIFITARGTVGECALAGVPMAMNQTSYALQGKQGFSQYYIFLMTLELVDALKTNATGAVFDAIIVDTFRQRFVLNIPVCLSKYFTNLVSPIFAMIQDLQRKNANLRRTRDLMLPRLVSGEIDVAELEIAGVEELALAAC